MLTAREDRVHWCFMLSQAVRSPQGDTVDRDVIHVCGCADNE